MKGLLFYNFRASGSGSVFPMCIRIQESEINADTDPKHCSKPEALKESYFSLFIFCRTRDAILQQLQNMAKWQEMSGKNITCERCFIYSKLKQHFRQEIIYIVSSRCLLKFFKKMRFHAIVEVP
jgi:hypothetical protein